MITHNYTLEKNKIGIQLDIINMNIRESINAKLNGRNGWNSSSSCKANEVQCFRQIGELKDVPCVKWSVVN